MAIVLVRDKKEAVQTSRLSLLWRRRRRRRRRKEEEEEGVGRGSNREEEEEEESRRLGEESCKVFRVAAATAVAAAKTAAHLNLVGM